MHPRDATPLSQNPVRLALLTMLSNIEKGSLLTAATRTSLLGGDRQTQRVEFSFSLVLETIQDGYSIDKWFRFLQKLHGLTRRDQCWYWDDQLLIPDILEVKELIMSEAHDVPYSGHLGFTKTMHEVTCLFWWPRLRLTSDGISVLVKLVRKKSLPIKHRLGCCKAANLPWG